MTVDHFVRGKEELSQDYALSGMSPVPYTIITDGCSAAKYSDVGAMALAHAARNVLGHYSDQVIQSYEGFGRAVIHQAENIANTLGRPKTILDATLGIIWIEDDNVWLRFYGDGVWFCLYKETGLHWAKISFDNNMPFYLRYWIDNESKKLYSEQVKNYTIQFKTSKGNSIEELQNRFITPIELSQAIDKIELIGIASDGLTALFDKNNDCLLELEAVLKEVTALKNRTGRFLMRRMRRMLDEFERQGIVQADDIAVGVISLGNE